MTAPGGMFNRGDGSFDSAVGEHHLEGITGLDSGGGGQFDASGVQSEDISFIENTPWIARGNLRLDHLQGMAGVGKALVHGMENTFAQKIKSREHG